MSAEQPDEFVFFEPRTGEQLLHAADFSVDAPQTELDSAYVLDPIDGDATVSMSAIEGVTPEGQPVSERPGHVTYSKRQKIFAGLFAIASLTGIGIGTDMIVHALNKDPACTAKANCDPVALPGSTPTTEASPEVTDTPLVAPSESPSPTAESVAPTASHAVKPARPAARPKHTAKKTGGNTPVASSVTLNPATCKVWSPSNPQPVIMHGGKTSVVIDTRYKDGCSPSFYSGATVHEQPNSKSGEVELGTSFTTAGSIALNSSVVAVDASKCGETVSATTTGGKVVSSSTWLHVKFPSGQGYIAAPDAGFARYTGPNAATC